MKASVFACGDCAAVLLAAGGERDTGTKEIGLGVTCQVHWVQAAPQATNAITSVDVGPSVAMAASKALEWGRAQVLARERREDLREAAVRVRAGVVRNDETQPAPVEVTPSAGAPVEIAVSVPAASPRPRGALGGDVAPPPPWATPPASRELGPVTRVAADLLCAWSQGDGTKADLLTVENAAIVARQLLKATAGA
jgi:hypothetical protein